MPGLLKPDAVCPACGWDLKALVRTTSNDGVTVEYFPSKIGARDRRKRRCLVNYPTREDEAAVTDPLHVSAA